MSPIEGVRMRFDHVSIAVKSIDRGVGFFRRYFPTIAHNHKQVSEQAQGGFLWQDFYLGGTSVEFIEELPGECGFITQFIRRHGEGLHHLCYEIDRIDPMIAALKAGGVRVVDEPPRPADDGRTRFDHVAIAVRDINSAMEFFRRYMPAEVLNYPMRSQSQGNFVLAHLEAAGCKLEFLQSLGPHTEDDFVGRFIERYGEGMHHLTIDVKDFDATLEQLRADGQRIVGRESNWRGERQFFISPQSAMGTLVQVWDGLGGPGAGSE